MDETTFEYEVAQLMEVSRLFPARRRHATAAHLDVDVSYLRTASSVEFGRHAWDEGGHS